MQTICQIKISSSQDRCSASPKSYPPVPGSVERRKFQLLRCLVSSEINGSPSRLLTFRRTCHLWLLWEDMALKALMGSRSQPQPRELADRIPPPVPFLKPCGDTSGSLSVCRVQPVTTATTGFTTTQLNERNIVLPISSSDQTKIPAPGNWGWLFYSNSFLSLIFG